MTHAYCMENVMFLSYKIQFLAASNKQQFGRSGHWCYCYKLSLVAHCRANIFNSIHSLSLSLFLVTIKNISIGLSQSHLLLVWLTVYKLILESHVILYVFWLVWKVEVIFICTESENRRHSQGVACCCHQAIFFKWDTFGII